jgi:uncharacterized protein YprB with RNaseH-like and TPR domain
LNLGLQLKQRKNFLNDARRIILGNKAYKDRMKANGLCVDCGKPAYKHHIRCLTHYKSNIEQAREHAAKKKRERLGYSCQSNMRILILDIETSPTLAHVWKLWKENVGLEQVVKATQMLSFAAKFYNEKEIFFFSLHSHGEADMLRNLHKLLDEADAVVHFNGVKFDIPHINREFLEFGLTPPSPYKQIDLLATVKKQFRFMSNRLQYVCKKLGIGEKYPHGVYAGHQLWYECVERNNPEAWYEMKIYNIHDVSLTELLYKRLLPWIQGHPNHNLYSDGSQMLCPQCGSTDLKETKPVPLTAGLYDGYVCNECGRNLRGRYTLVKKERARNTILGVHGA